MKDGAIRKVNSYFNLEKVRTIDSSLQASTESFRIGKSQDRRRQSWWYQTKMKYISNPREASSRRLLSGRVLVFNIKKTQQSNSVL